METISVLLLCLILFLFSVLIQLSRGNLSRKRKNLQPPGPPGWPILGNFFDLGAAPHQTLHKLKPKYGPVLRLKLGSVNTVVIQSAMAASEFFKKHDHDFCDRKCPTVLTAHNYYQGTIAFGRYDKHWRMRRRICSTELLMSRQTNEVARLRRKCIDDMIRYIEEDTAAAQERGEEGKVKLARFLFLMSFNLVGNLVLSRDLLNSGSKEGKEFFDAMNDVMVWAGKPNLADVLPVLKWLDPQGIKRNMVRDMGRALEIVSGFVKERVAEEKETKDLLDVLLEHTGEGKQGSDSISNQIVIIIILVKLT